jgi:cardiolipin synthase A/B
VQSNIFPTLTAWSLPIPAGLITSLYILLAGIVTADVLLRKSDVRAALGWIAVAWFSPILGSLLYYMFGINRISRRALRLGMFGSAGASLPAPPAQLGAAPNITMLSELSGRVTGGPLTDGNGVVILQGGDEAYPAMLAAIREAKQCIGMTSYIFRNDAAGRDFAGALTDARKRGVAVRVLLDSVGIGYIFPIILYRLKLGGVRAARFLHTWLPWRMPFLNMRNHRKLLVVDGATAFIGGMNIGAENSRRLTPTNYINDIHFRIAGPVVRLVMDAFARDWTFTTAETFEDACWWPKLEPAGPVFARGLRSGPDADIYKLEIILGAAFTLAKRRIRIVTPYFLPDQRLQFAIAEACLRGVQVDIIIPEHCNYIVMDWAMRAHLRFFKNIAANVYITPLPFDHSKLATMDDEWCLIGSSNWDARSFRLNFEFDLECCDAQLCRNVDEIIDKKIALGRQLTSQELIAGPVWVRLRDAAARLLMPYL